MFELDEPVELGRYKLLRVLGRGTYGTVFEARDTELQRRIAVKVLHSRRPGSTSSVRRLLSEARAMALVNHPNVVDIFDASATDGHVWIAMALVEGTTLQDWATDHPLSGEARDKRLRELLEGAGRGLAAAHATGLVHRDFKPANVLVGADGSVKVADFGLARAWRLVDWSTEEQTTSDVGTAGPAGTPRYMSPEQLRGETADAVSDQFNFAVAAWELLLGQHPFDHQDRATLLRAIEVGPNAPPSAAVTPTWYIAALQRALAFSPQGRFSSMESLLGALSPARATRHRTVAVAAIAVGVCLAATATWLSTETTRAQCSLAEAQREVDLVWSPNRRAQVHASLRAAELADGDRVIARVDDALDQHARRWAAERLAVCEEGWHGDKDTEVEFDAQVTCLQLNLETTNALLSRLSVVDPQLATRAVSVALSLTNPRQCRSVAPDLPETPASRELRSALSITVADQLVGRYREAAQQAESLAGDARRLGLPRQTAFALELAGSAWAELGDERRFEFFADAYYIAAEFGDDRARARLAVKLARHNAYVQRTPVANTWIRHAEAALTRQPSDPQRIALDHVRAILLRGEERREKAVEALKRLLADIDRYRESNGGIIDIDLQEVAWLASSGLASTLAAVGRHEEATAVTKSLRDTTIRELGSAHPHLVLLAMTEGRVAIARGQYDAAIGYLEEATVLAERAYGPINTRTANARGILAWAHARAGHLDEAEVRYRAALASTDVPNHFTTRLLRGWSNLHTRRGEPDQALALLRRAVNIGEDVLPDGSAELAKMRQQLAEATAELEVARSHAGQ